MMSNYEYVGHELDQAALATNWKAYFRSRRYPRPALAAVFPRQMQRVELFYLGWLGVLASLANRLLLLQGAPNERQVKFWDRTIIPASRVLDRLAFYVLGRSVIAVYRS